MYKTYLEILCRIVHNFVYNFVHNFVHNLPLFTIMVLACAEKRRPVIKGYVKVAANIRTGLLFIVKRQIFAEDLLRLLVCLLILVL